MSNVFVCQIDKKTFSSEDELVKHMLTDHTMQHANDVKIEHIVYKLQEAFPFAKINVEETKD